MSSVLPAPPLTAEFGNFNTVFAAWYEPHWSMGNAQHCPNNSQYCRGLNNYQHSGPILLSYHIPQIYLKMMLVVIMAYIRLQNV